MPARWNADVSAPATWSRTSSVPSVAKKEFKLTLQRRRRLLQRQWPVSRAGNSYLNVDGFNIVVYLRAGFWVARVEHRSTGVRMFTRWSFNTPEQAKLAAFDVMQEMRQAIAKHQPNAPHDWRELDSAFVVPRTRRTSQSAAIMETRIL
jgi:hypothetical protein